MTSCADQPVVTQTEYKRVYLPERFLRDCPAPVWGGGDFEDVGRFAVRFRAALKNCNLQLQSGRAYQECERAREAGRVLPGCQPAADAPLSQLN